LLDTWVSNDPEGDRNAEPSHTVEDVASDLCLGPLIAQNPGVKPPADDCFISIHRGFDQAPAAIELCWNVGDGALRRRSGLTARSPRRRFGR
jgi:hypothetical protein